LEARTASDDPLTNFRTLRHERQENLSEAGYLEHDEGEEVLYLIAASEPALCNPETHIDWINELPAAEQVPVPGFDVEKKYFTFSRGVKNVYEGPPRSDRRLYLYDSGVAEAIIHDISDAHKSDEIRKRTLAEYLEPYLEHVWEVFDDAGIVGKDVYVGGTLYNAKQCDLYDYPDIDEDSIHAPVASLGNGTEAAAESITDAIFRSASRQI
jgi:hypothetical protein